MVLPMLATSLRASDGRPMSGYLTGTCTALPRLISQSPLACDKGSWRIPLPMVGGLPLTMSSQHLNTWQACATEGLQFLPLVVEGCAGGWGPTASKTWQLLAAALSSRSGEGASVELQRMLQSFSMALHGENARAVLRRLE